LSSTIFLISFLPPVKITHGEKWGKKLFFGKKNYVNGVGLILPRIMHFCPCGKPCGIWGKLFVVNAFSPFIHKVSRFQIFRKNIGIFGFLQVMSPIYFSFL